MNMVFVLFFIKSDHRFFDVFHAIVCTIQHDWWSFEFGHFGTQFYDEFEQYQSGENSKKQMLIAHLTDLEFQVPIVNFLRFVAFAAIYIRLVFELIER